MQGSFRKSEISSIDHVEIVDPATVRIVLKSPSGAFLAQLTDRSGMILPPKAPRQEGKDFASHPVCSGPFKFVERVPQDHVTLERFADYWDAKDIHFDRVVYQVFLDSSVRLANLKAGSYRSHGIHRADRRRRGEGGPEAAAGGLRRARLFRHHQQSGQWRRSRTTRTARTRWCVRRSTPAIDRAALVNVVYQRHVCADCAGGVRQLAVLRCRAEAATARCGEGQGAAATGRRHAAGEARAAGAKQPDVLQSAEVIQSMAAEAGFDVHIQAMEFASSLAASQRGDFQAYLIGWSGRVDIDGNTYAVPAQRPGQQCQPLRQSDRGQAAGRGARHRPMSRRRAATLCADVAELRQDLPITYLWNARNIVGMSAKLNGFRPMPDGMIRVQGLEMAK